MTPEESLAYKAIAKTVVRLGKQGLDDMDIRAALALVLLQVCRASSRENHIEEMAAGDLSITADLLRGKGIL